MSTANAIEAVSVCVFAEGKLLSLKRSAHSDAFAGAWEVVSGRVRENEDLQSAAKRECYEECGLHITPLFVERYDAMRGDRPMVVNVFVAKGAMSNVVLSDEHDDFRWLSLADFELLCAFEQLVAAAKKCEALINAATH